MKIVFAFFLKIYSKREECAPFRVDRFFPFQVDYFSKRALSAGEQ